MTKCGSNDKAVCGCKIVTGYSPELGATEETWNEIKFCPLHSMAEEMRDLLTDLMSVFQKNSAHYFEIKAILAKAQGGTK